MEQSQEQKPEAEIIALREDNQRLRDDRAEHFPQLEHRMLAAIAAYREELRKKVEAEITDIQKEEGWHSSVRLREQSLMCKWFLSILQEQNTPS